MNLFALADRYLPPGTSDPHQVRQLRAIILGSTLGMAFSTATAMSYLLMGSPWSAFSIQLITLALLAVPFAVRRGVKASTIGQLAAGVTSQASVVVSMRSGGFASPAVTWCFMLPVIAYLAAGPVASIVWSAVSLCIFGFFFGAERLGVSFVQDFSPSDLSLLRVSGYPGLIISNVVILMMVERIRVASQRVLDEANRDIERQRILRDMHDGVGSQLMGLLVRARSGRLEGHQLVHGLETSLDDLRLVVDSLDPSERSLEIALGELRLRTQVHCEAAGVELKWVCRGTDDLVLATGVTLDVLRACQEMLANAIRHSGAKRIEFTLSLETVPNPVVSLVVRDHGVGFDPSAPPRSGRGLPSLRARATKLAGQLTVSAVAPGVEVSIRFPA